MHSQLRLTHGVVLPRGGFCVFGHSGHLGHPVKTPRNGKPIFVDGDSTLRSGLYCIDLVRKITAYAYLP